MNILSTFLAIMAAWSAIGIFITALTCDVWGNARTNDKQELFLGFLAGPVVFLVVVLTIIYKRLGKS